MAKPPASYGAQVKLKELGSVIAAPEPTLRCK
jgi:hypothetical protein